VCIAGYSGVERVTRSNKRQGSALRLFTLSLGPLATCVNLRAAYIDDIGKRYCCYSAGKLDVFIVVLEKVTWCLMQCDLITEPLMRRDFNGILYGGTT
jgi:hypothetical protein